ncbi:mycothiol synthase [Clavibacter sepedonicus]|uniref:Mycothiol acetyltransferase n=1 Tax=Clavibacter sepedonicus TaxID=31964 RepID=MSHD_CLASE|nr:MULTISPECIES: mycothiol synthase [Clavibacter]B0RAV5.1 RecName: Full=Mycothiol acetyltransferase; Short=MSH acetyltransferase; AltName: Full=Mycothiol synthase [Clavibacter sepedonicus]MBD5380616.1 mycothiol synthase [Clavibacter sp.]OQJ48334.1 mycothiol synthase [Clavibacter sepedonicus]OQJ53817.1 mycothiol synthase [Clavibacter sepedonicus]UUK65328.1 mycothiol synthase [Clavibacter sepedonicus]CAQ02802.1 putative acetyltransferase [Clavibacter sepedonicus]
MSAFPPPPEPDAPRVAHVEPAPDAVRGILALADRARADDGVAPFNEQTRLTLGADGGPTLLLAHGTDDDPLGAAVVAHGDAGIEAELVVDPAHRRRGVGRALLDAVLAEAAGSPVSVWAHGDHPAARALADATGLDRARELLQLRASVAEARTGLGERQMPAGVALSSFTADDADDWVALNARAFASHPEQGRMTRGDLDDRVAEAWFDPASLLLARDADGRLAGFHWLKVDGGQAEVYVLGVDPDRAARGLGSALLAAGLDLLAERGHDEVDLYVEADNTPALALYRRAAFRDAAVDVQYRRA